MINFSRRSRSQLYPPKLRLYTPSWVAPPHADRLEGPLYTGEKAITDILRTTVEEGRTMGDQPREHPDGPSISTGSSLAAVRVLPGIIGFLPRGLIAKNLYKGGVSPL